MSGPDILALLLTTLAERFDLFGALGLTLGFASGIMPRPRLILLTSGACAACFGAHYSLLGSATGVAMCAMSVLQSIIAARFAAAETRPAWFGTLFAASSLVVALLVLATWNGWPSAFAGAGALFAIAARLQSSASSMRRLFIGASLLWAGHNILVGSAFGFACDVLTLSGLVIALWKSERRGGVALGLHTGP
jgi:hypothetical protein